jgi:hypothetical protein
MRACHVPAIAAITVASLALPPPGLAQTPERRTEPQPLGNSFTFDAFTDLPSASNIFSVLDTSIPELISDRVDAGSLTAGQPARFGAQGSSWTQTLFRIGDVDISDPSAGGTALIVPGVLGWERMDVATAAIPLDANAAGPVITLVPRRPAAAWRRSVELFGAPSGLLSRTTTTAPPAIARLNGWSSARLMASGPLVEERVGLVMAAMLTSSSHFERDDPTLLSDKLGSVFSHLVFTPASGEEIRFLGWVQRTRSPYVHRTAFGQPAAAQRATSLHLQTVWERPRNDHSVWTGFGAYSERRRSTDLQPVGAIVTERLYEGPVQELVAPFGTERAWSAGARIKPISWTRRHTPQAGVVFSGGSARTRVPFDVRIGELVHGLPARVWEYTAPGVAASSSQVTLAAFAGDTIAISPRLTVDGGVRFELVRAQSPTNPQAISWHDWFPTAGLRWEMADRGRFAWLVRFNRYGHRLLLGSLAYGDEASPTANVYRWAATGPDPGLQRVGPLVSRVGPGTNGNPSFSAIDPQLERPYINELTFGFESRPGNQTILRFSAVVRHEGQLIGLVNTGVPLSAYLPIPFIDPGIDHGGGQTLIAWNRSPGAFGADRYLLTNPAGHHATFASGQISLQTTINRLFLMFGGTAGRSEETSAHRGFLASENDHGIIGDAFADPNGGTNARGRPFTERGYTIKTSGVYRFTDTLRLGVAARYQDGQHFARLVIVPDLNQGVEAIRAFVNGKTRFTYTLTVDARLQKAFEVGRGRITGVIDAFNLLNTGTEIEEFVVTGPLSRAISAVQPPRSIRVGLRMEF